MLKLISGITSYPFRYLLSLKVEYIALWRGVERGLVVSLAEIEHKNLFRTNGLALWQFTQKVS